MVDIFASDFFEPEFYEIADWHNAEQTATPKWFSVWNLQGRLFAHPTVIDAMKQQLTQKEG